MNNEVIFLVEEAPEGGYQARALGESIFTEAENMDELKENVKESVLAHFDVDIKFRVLFDLDNEL